MQKQNWSNQNITPITISIYDCVLYSNTNIIETEVHTLLQCPKYNDNRLTL